MKIIIIISFLVYLSIEIRLLNDYCSGCTVEKNYKNKKIVHTFSVFIEPLGKLIFESFNRIINIEEINENNDLRIYDGLQSSVCFGNGKPAIKDMNYMNYFTFSEYKNNTSMGFHIYKNGYFLCSVNFVFIC